MKFTTLLFIFWCVSISASERIETEFKLGLPKKNIESAWEYLNQKFGAESRISTEYFTDIYFDTRKLALLKRQSSLRRRLRRIPGNIKDPKHERALVQLKISADDQSLLQRKELKFEVREKFKHAHYGTPPLLLIQEKDKPHFLQRLKLLKINAPDLFVTVVMTQKRRRMYLNFNHRPFATISLDEAESSKLWSRAHFCEIEVELNENIYTQADPAERLAMDRYLKEIKNDLEKNLPYVEMDLSPKYNKIWLNLNKNFPYYLELMVIESWFH